MNNSTNLTKPDFSFLFMVILLFVFIIICQHQSYQDYRSKVTLMNVMEQKKIKHQLTYKIDSLYHLNRTNLAFVDVEEKDSIWRELTIAMQADYDSRLNNVLADLRQAYNDQTTTLNTYISIWIAIYSIAIGLITVVLGYINMNRAKEDLLEHKKQIYEDYQKEFEKVTQKAIEDKRAIEDAQNKVNVALDSIKTVNLKNNLIIIVQSITASAQMARFSFLEVDVQVKISELFELASRHNKQLANSIEPSEDILQENSFLIYVNVLNVMVDALTFVYTAKVEMNQLDNLRNCVNQLMASNIKKAEDVEKIKDLFQDVGNYMGFLCTHAKMLGRKNL